MDCSFKASIAEMSSTNFDPKAAEKVNLQIIDPNSSKITPYSKGIDNGTNITE